MAVSRSGDLLAWGWNAAAQLGLGVSQKADILHHPASVLGVPLNANAHIAAGRVHSLLVTDDPVSDDADPETSSSGAMHSIPGPSRGCVPSGGKLYE